VKNNKNFPAGGKVEPPRCSKVLHLCQFSTVFTNQLQRTALKICSILEQAPDQTVERNQLKEMCSVCLLFLGDPPMGLIIYINLI